MTNFTWISWIGSWPENHREPRSDHVNLWVYSAVWHEFFEVFNFELCLLLKLQEVRRVAYRPYAILWKDMAVFVAGLDVCYFMGVEGWRNKIIFIGCEDSYSANFVLLLDSLGFDFQVSFLFFFPPSLCHISLIGALFCSLTPFPEF